MGRTISVPNFGLFYNDDGPPRQMRFKALEKLIPSDLQWDGPAPGIAPVTKAKFDKISDLTGMTKSRVDEILQSVIREFWSSLKGNSEVSFDMPGLGQLKAELYLSIFGFPGEPGKSQNQCHEDQG